MGFGSGVGVAIEARTVEGNLSFMGDVRHTIVTLLLHVEGLL